MACTHFTDKASLWKLLSALATVTALASAAQAGTIFQLSATLTAGASQLSLAGTLDIDTIDGSLDAVDLVFSPVPAFIQSPTPTLEYTSANVTHYPTWQFTELQGLAYGGFANAWLWIRLPVADLVGYQGGPILTSTSALNFQSGVIARGTMETGQIRTYPLRSGSLTVVPEPEGWAMMGFAAMLLLLMGSSRRPRR